MSAMSHPVVSKTILSVFMLLVSVIVVQAGHAEELVTRKDASQIELDSISFDVMKGGTTQKRHAVVTWFAPQYVEAMGRNAGDKDEEIQPILEVLRPYNMFLVLSRTVQSRFSQKMETPEEILSRIRFVARNGEVYKPLAEDEISDDARAIYTAFARGCERQAGLKMTAAIFPAVDQFGKPLADAAKKGSFKIKMEKLSIAWELPLDSVVNRGN